MNRDIDKNKPLQNNVYNHKNHTSSVFIYPQVSHAH